jgi:hypothetical protein
VMGVTAAVTGAMPVTRVMGVMAARGVMGERARAARGPHLQHSPAARADPMQSRCPCGAGGRGGAGAAAHDLGQCRRAPDEHLRRARRSACIVCGVRRVVGGGA